MFRSLIKQRCMTHSSVFFFMPYNLILSPHKHTFYAGCWNHDKCPHHSLRRLSPASRANLRSNGKRCERAPLAAGNARPVKQNAILSQVPARCAAHATVAVSSASVKSLWRLATRTTSMSGGASITSKIWSASWCSKDAIPLPLVKRHPIIEQGSW